MDKQKQHNKYEIILEFVREFCAKKLNEEYFELAEKMVQKLNRKRTKPLESGQPQIWAASIIHALGTLNFLFDKSFEPYITIEELNKHFGTNKSTTGSKSNQIRDMLKLDRWDNEFSTKRMIDNNPFSNLVIVDGYIVPLDTLPENLQIEVRKARAEGNDISFTTQ